MPIYNLIEYSDNYSTTSGNSWHFYRDEPFLNANDATADFPADNGSSASFKFKIKIADRAENDGTENVKSRVLAKSLSSFWITLKMQLINYEISLILTWSNRYFVIDNTIARQEQ